MMSEGSCDNEDYNNNNPLKLNKLTLRYGTHHSGLISMVTVTGDIFPAPALQQRIFIAMAAKTFKVKETRTGSEIGMPKRSANFTVGS